MLIDDINGAPTSREEATLFEPLAKAIFSHWKPITIDLRTVILSEVNQVQGISGKGFVYRY